ncbi:hypothetical protein SVIOM342S_03610 [Streptomyces violaceorubidus]
MSAVEESHRGRIPGLAPIRAGRMAATPFAFLRGSAGLMAYDLARTPVTGIGAQICGDAHAANFGLYGDARGGLVIDLNDFDETVHGPWEWDLKRLAASLVLAGREAGADEDTCREAAHDAAGAYRRTMRLLAKLPALDAWNAIADEELVSHTDAHDLLGTLERVSEKAQGQHQRALRREVHRVHRGRRAPASNGSTGARSCSPCSPRSWRRARSAPCSGSPRTTPTGCWTRSPNSWRPRCASGRRSWRGCSGRTEPPGGGSGSVWGMSFGAGVPTVGIEDLEDGDFLLDVREDDEWQAGHAAGALHVPQRVRGPVR